MSILADFATCFSWMLDNEDRPRRYNVTTDNNGGGVVAGINAKSYPSAFAHIASLPQDERGDAVEAFYLSNFWNQWYAALKSDDLAKRVFDMAVNAGPATTVRILQGAIPEAGGPAVAIDGKWGPSTVNAANACDQNQLLLAYKAARCQHYKDIVEANPADQPYLAAWIARAEK